MTSKLTRARTRTSADSFLSLDLAKSWTPRSASLKRKPAKLPILQRCSLPPPPRTCACCNIEVRVLTAAPVVRSSRENDPLAEARAQHDASCPRCSASHPSHLPCPSARPHVHLAPAHPAATAPTAPSHAAPPQRRPPSRPTTAPRTTPPRLPHLRAACAHRSRPQPRVPPKFMSLSDESSRTAA
jgi:hypothetical protein